MILIPRLRKVLLIISVIFLPVTLYYLSPFMLIHGARQHIITGSLVVFIILMFVGMFFGRFFCGWFCPIGAISEIIATFLHTEKVSHKYHWTKFLIFGCLIGLFTLLWFKEGNIPLQFDFFFRTSNGISVYNLHGVLVLTILVIVLLFMTSIFGKRSFCHYVCWVSPFMIIGQRIRILFTGYKGFVPSLNTEKCISCGKCKRICVMSLVDMDNRKSNTFKDECIACGECMEACPENAFTMPWSKQ